MPKNKAMYPRNPFLITEEYISEEYFCDREAESEILKGNIVNGRNTVLISPRRMGKTGLIAHVLADREISDNYITFSIDLFATTSMQEMILLLSNEIVDRMKKREDKYLEKFVSVVKSLRPGVKMNPATGELEFSLSLGEIVQPTMSLKEIFECLDNTPFPCIVAIDEFQQIAEYKDSNAIALLRTFVQKCRNCSFIFAGSKRRMMEKLFNSPSEPFYQSCSPLYLDVIDRKKYCRFAETLFAKSGKAISDTCFNAIYDCFDGHTWYVQRLLNELFAMTEKGETADDDMFRYALEHVIRLGGKTFEEQFTSYPAAQKELLIAIAKEKNANGITSIAFVKKHALKSPSTVQSAARALYEKEVITKSGQEFQINNKLFGMWLSNVFGRNI